MDTFLIGLTVCSFAACVSCAFLTWRTVDADRRRSAARVAALATAVQGEGVMDTAQPVSVSSMFGTKPGGSVSASPLLKAAVVGALGVTLVVVAATTTSRTHSAEAAPATSSTPLELIAMTHTRSGNQLTVTGTVRNPKGGTPLGRIDAVVSAFDRTGGVAANGTAPIDFLNLAPGDESKFVVKVPGASTVSRYRVSFRTGTSVLRHIDRRAQAQLAVR